MSLSYYPTFLVRVRRWLSAFRFDCLSCCDALPSICFPLSFSLPPSLTHSFLLSSLSPVSFTLSLPTPWSSLICVTISPCKTHQARDKASHVRKCHTMSRNVCSPLVVNQVETPAAPAVTDSAPQPEHVVPQQCYSIGLKILSHINSVRACNLKLSICFQWSCCICVSQK